MAHESHDQEQMANFVKHDITTPRQNHKLHIQLIQVVTLGYQGASRLNAEPIC